ncbi:hypothetical protein ABZ092_36260 [Streptomyces bobili]|uniref:DUF7439 family protein n=1 Tax=Streptomyces bobili TaxID=67280 RepID=UPI0033B6FAB6
MSKHRKVSAKGLGVITRALPTKYKSKAGLVSAIVGLLVSLAAVLGTDYPQLAVVVQALTAFGFVESDPE